MDRRNFLLSAAMIPVVLNGEEDRDVEVQEHELGREVVIIRDPSEPAYAIGDRGKMATQFLEGEQVSVDFQRIDNVVESVELISSMIMENERNPGAWTVRTFKDGGRVAIVGHGPRSRAYKVKRIII